MPDTSIMGANYAQDAVPENYTCDDCGAHGVKLYREWQTLADRTALLCAPCAAKNQEKDISDMDAEGHYHESDGHRTLQIGRFVSAIPTEEGGAFWGWTWTPDNGVAWWERLPIRL